MFPCYHLFGCKLSETNEYLSYPYLISDYAPPPWQLAYRNEQKRKKCLYHGSNTSKPTQEQHGQMAKHFSFNIFPTVSKTSVWLLELFLTFGTLNNYTHNNQGIIQKIGLMASHSGRLARNVMPRGMTRDHNFWYLLIIALYDTRPREKK